MQTSEMQELKANIKFLLEGIDPQSRIKFENDSILSSKYNKKLLKKVCELIDLMIKTNSTRSKVDNRYKEDFHIPKNSRDEISLSKEPIPVSVFTYALNAMVDTAFVKKLRATQITSWLYSQGYLSEIEHDDGKRFKVLTNKSHLIGLTSKEMINSFGRQYSVILYNIDAQKFVIDNLDAITKANRM